MSAHTPGPWAWLGEPGCSALNAAEGRVLEFAGYEGMWPGAYDAARDAANLRLIAAAPDLLYAAMLVDQADGLAADREEELEYMGIALRAIRAAIAKATGSLQTTLEEPAK